MIVGRLYMDLSVHQQSMVNLAQKLSNIAKKFLPPLAVVHVSEI